MYFSVANLTLPDANDRCFEHGKQREMEKPPLSDHYIDPLKIKNPRVASKNKPPEKTKKPIVDKIQKICRSVHFIFSRESSLSPSLMGER